uniref:Ubiquitin-like protease family profile domain-containing protein n=1 Tax=Setaria italica TaxID=4555 RepID=K3YYT0_SETIT
MDLNIEAPTDVDLNDRPFKKSKYSESIVSESDNQIGCCDPLDKAYDYLPKDYTMSDFDFYAQMAIETSLESDVPVKIDGISVKQKELLCLLDQSKYVEDDVISAYICCIKDRAHLRNMNDIKFYYENPFVTGLIKRDGLLGINEGGNFITEIVKKYLKHEMILLPVSIEETHWYLAILNVKNCEIHEDLIDHNWKNLQVTEWTITEQLEKPIQKDGSSCGLFMLKFMEYWTGETLSHAITQEDISQFRQKLASILFCWKTNTAEMTTKSVQNHGTEENSNDVSLMSILSTMSEQELLGGLCTYIKSINCAETLKKVWIQNSKPYSITLTVKKLQEMINEDLPWTMIVTTDFGRPPNYRKNLDVEWLAETVRSWPGISYSVSRCKTILMPIEFNGGFILIVLNKDTRTLYILDPTPLNPIYQYNPNARYVKKLLWTAEYLPKAMSKTCPGSIWNEDIFLWRQIIIPDVTVQNRELSGYLVSLFMSTWKDVELPLPVLKDGYKLRKRILGQLLTYKDNECKYNMPSGVLDFISCICNTQQ